LDIDQRFGEKEIIQAKEVKLSGKRELAESKECNNTQVLGQTDQFGGYIDC